MYLQFLVFFLICYQSMSLQLITCINHLVLLCHGHVQTIHILGCTAPSPDNNFVLFLPVFLFVFLFLGCPRWEMLRYCFNASTYRLLYLACTCISPYIRFLKKIKMDAPRRNECSIHLSMCSPTSKNQTANDCFLIFWNDMLMM